MLEDPSAVRRTPGRLVLSPTSCFPDAYPGGGKPLGLKRSFSWDPGEMRAWTRDEGRAEIRRGIVTEFLPVVAFVVLQDDPDILKYVFRVYNQTGTINGFPQDRAEGGGTTGPALDLPPLLFWPWDKRDKALYIPRPMATFDGTPIAHRLDQYKSFGLKIRCGRTDGVGVSSLPWQYSTLERISL